MKPKHWWTGFYGGVLLYLMTVTACVVYVPVEYVSVSMPFLGLLGQSGFMLLFATRNWRDNRFMRALMLKSFTLWLLFLLGVIRLTITGRPAIHSGDPVFLTVFATGLNILVVVAVWYQFVALFAEVRRGYTDELESMRRA